MRYIIFLGIALIGLVSYGQMVTTTVDTYYSGIRDIEVYQEDNKLTLYDSERQISQFYTFDENAVTRFPIRSVNNSFDNVYFISEVNITSINENLYSSGILGEYGDYPDVYFQVEDSENNILTSLVYNEFAFPRFVQLSIPVHFPLIIRVYDEDSFTSDDLIAEITINQPTTNYNYNSNETIIDFTFINKKNPALDAFFGAQVAYDYFNEKFDWAGPDGFGQKAFNSHLYLGSNSILLNNAKAESSSLIASNNFLLYGFGDQLQKDAQSTLDFVGHEYSHLVTDFKGVFKNNFGETGALKEAFGDIFAVCINNYANPDNDLNWRIGDFNLPDTNGGVTPPLRLLSNPTSLEQTYEFVITEDESYCFDYRQPDTYEYSNLNCEVFSTGDCISLSNSTSCWVDTNSQNDNGGIHTNCSIITYWFYLIGNRQFTSEALNGINQKGRSYSVKSFDSFAKAERLVYEIISSPDLNNDSVFEDVKNVSISLASLWIETNQYNFNQDDLDSIINAWYAVGLLENPNEFCSTGIVLNDLEGSIEDGSLNQSYNNNQNCSWTIAPSGASSVSINFTSFNLGNGDTVRLYDGLDNMASPLGVFSGTSIPNVIVSSTGAVFVEFITDASNVGEGWSLDYSGSVPNENCNSLTELFFASATFDDGSGSENYLNNSNCTWRIAPEGASFINLNFQFIDIEDNQDIVTIYDGLDENAPPIGTYTGDTIPSTITANSGTAFVKFTSNNVTTSEGWAISYTSDGIAPCIGTTTLTDSTGIVSDGSGTDNYGNNANCSWLIQPDNATSIRVVFDDMKLQAPTYDGNGTIYNDYLEIYDGTNDDGEPMGFYTGNQLLPLILQSSNGSLFVKFVTNSSITDSGWQFTYEASYDDFCAGTTILEATSGTITDGSSTGNYNSNSDCRWLIQPENATSIELDITFLDTELGKDGIVVYDGPNTSYPFTSYSGSNLPSKIYSTGGAMLIRFLSDDVNEFQGFEANYVANIAPEGNPNSMVKYQYWFNDDYSNAINENNFGAVNSLNINVQASTLNLNDGINTLHIRTKDKIGLWSSVLSEYIYVQKPTGGLNNEITEYEYWFNDDYGSRISGAGNNSNPFVLGINEGVGDLAIGLNTFHIRFKDKKGLWSSITSEYVYNNKPSGLGTNVITGYRYWFNDDYDNRVSLEVTQNETLTLIEDIDVSNLQPSSTNLIHFQFKDLYGNWSSVVTEEFFFQTLSTNGIDSSSFGVYPNPTNGKIFIVSQYQEGILELYNALGKKIMSLETVPSELDLTNLQDGIYVLKIKNGNNKLEKKIIKY
ncbi:CUB domain-containing protein [Winogradskyella litorisediminis]|uniref:CUB domain-containing protein n=1 Tax=Winogradskyella litorisediminis TaxID=1156618 RepID=A0ABW3N7S1_9FLAO